MAQGVEQITILFKKFTATC